MKTAWCFLILLVFCVGCSNNTTMEHPPAVDMSMDLKADMSLADASVDMDASVDLVADQASDLAELSEMGELPTQMGYPGDPVGIRGLRVLFIGNSFTHQGPIPALVKELAKDAGWPVPDARYVAPGGKRLSFHRTNPDTLNAVDEGRWDVVVLQEFSTGATDNAGNPEQFKQDAVWFYDRIQTSSPGARVLLYMTWARHPNHGIYPGTFQNPEQMQAQIRFHYHDAANRVIPTTSMSVNKINVAVAPVGNAWERHLTRSNASRLHASDDYHAGALGQYLNALVLYSVIYNRSATGLGALNVDRAAAGVLQSDADAVTGKTIMGGPVVLKNLQPLATGQRVEIDFGGQSRQSPPNWNNIYPERQTIANLVTSTGIKTTTGISVTQSFAGANLEGLTNNGLQWPGEASSDTFWVGSFDGHQQALAKKGQVTLTGLNPQGFYTLRLFASRTGNDNGNGRLTRYVVASQTQDVEISDNTTNVALFERIKPDANGRIDVVVSPSPSGSSRFAYLGALSIQRVE